MKRSSCCIVAVVSALGFFSHSACSDEPVGDLFAAANYVVRYYDRNGDGRVDFELHQLPNGADADWALIDTHFCGRFDLRVHWGVVVERQHVDLAVPKNVKITRGKPPVYETQ